MGKWDWGLENWPYPGTVALTCGFISGLFLFRILVRLHEKREVNCVLAVIAVEFLFLTLLYILRWKRNRLEQQEVIG